ncbi:MAG TPA: sterol-binding protein [Burkholderiales bacterium]|nr:sterol-binding protein [Burkholderiales bacterium]
MLSRTFAAAVNRLLRDAEWATARLVPHAGKRARIEVPPVYVAFEIAGDGFLTAVESADPPDVSVQLAPAAAVRFLQDRQAAWKEARVEGDADLASAISFVAANLRWDFEEDLSRVVGDVAAQHLGELLRASARFPAAAAESAAANVAEYLTEERHALPTRLEAEAFLLEVDELRDAAERLEKRLQRLEARAADKADR